MWRRNVANITKALSELTRVLRPGASLAVLDFNNSDEPLVDGLQVSCCVANMHVIARRASVCLCGLSRLNKLHLASESVRLTC